MEDTVLGSVAQSPRSIALDVGRRSVAFQIVGVKLCMWHQTRCQRRFSAPRRRYPNVLENGPAKVAVGAAGSVEHGSKVSGIFAPRWLEVAWECANAWNQG